MDYHTQFRLRSSKQLTQFTQKSVSEISPPLLANRMAKKRAAERAKKNLPTTPEKKAEVVAAVTQSLRTRKILEKHGLMKSPEEENKIVALKAMASDFPEGIKVIKNARSNNALEALGAVKTLSFGKNVKK